MTGTTPRQPSPLCGDRPATAKVAGLQLGHFGGFVKESWRANDWMWGILDGASRLWSGRESRQIRQPGRDHPYVE
jgi:Protein of unknown function (DUF3376)